MSNIVIAIDGPAGAGKSTIAKRLAKEVGLSYLDTGAMYRALALKVSREGVDPADGPGAAALLETIQISFGQGEPQPVFLDGEDITGLIRTLEIGDLASTISAHSEVRRGLVAMQQAIVRQGGVVLEGRDTTTVIAPDADIKIYMTASLEERAARRTRELETKGQSTDYSEVRAQISTRDHRDITREDSPLRVDSSAHVIETGTLSVDEVFQRILKLIPTE